MKYFFVILISILIFPVKSDEISKKYIGVWGASSTAGMAIYASFRIDENYISWAGHRDISPECKVGYKVIEHISATTHHDVPANTFISDKYKNTVFDYFMIELEPSECSDFLRMLLPFPRTDAFYSDQIYNTHFIGYRKDGSKESILVNVGKPE
jgi:hypothetical protein